MMENDTFGCGHERTKANTKHRSFGPICRTCHNQRTRNAYARESESERYHRHRIRYLPVQIEQTERKLEMLRNEARRYGMTDLLEERQP